MTIIERILKTLEQRNSKMSELCSFLDINTSTMANWKTRNSDPPAKYIAAIADFLGVSLEYLLTGKETPSPPLTDDEHELLETYKMAGKASQLRILAYALDELENFKNKTTPSNVLK